MSDNREGSQSAVDLLELVRSAEDEATLEARRASQTPAEVPAAPAEEVVDVGDEAVEAPPTMPPPTEEASERPPATEIRPRALQQPRLPPDVEPPAKTSAPAKTTRDPPRALPPAAGIVLLLVLVIGALVLITR